MKKLLLFGSFDGIHDGHRAMLREAKEHGDYVVAVLASDDTIEAIKGREPKYTLATRIQNLKDEHLIDEVRPGEPYLDHGRWGVLKRIKPQIIGIGYDQDELKASLEAHLDVAYPDVETEAGFIPHPKKPTIVVLKPYKPETYKSSLI